MALSTKRYYTAFLFSDPLYSHLHCTHKYLGEMDSIQLHAVKSLIAGYFNSKGGFKPFSLDFSHEDFFGEETRVLKAFGAIQKYQDLRVVLNAIRSDDYTDYVPHVTTDSFLRVDGLFSAYAIMTNKHQIVWSTAKTEPEPPIEIPFDFS